MSAEDEWGEWVRHKIGAPCPLQLGEVADIVERYLYRPGPIVSPSVRITAAVAASPNWSRQDILTGCRVVRFRVRKPRGMVSLSKLLETPVPVGKSPLHVAVDDYEEKKL